MKQELQTINRQMLEIVAPYVRRTRDPDAPA
jgi:hypothetical protein